MQYLYKFYISFLFLCSPFFAQAFNAEHLGWFEDYVTSGQKSPPEKPDGVIDLQDLDFSVLAETYTDLDPKHRRPLVDLTGWNLANTTFQNPLNPSGELWFFARNSNLTRANLADASFHGIDLDGVTLNHANCEGTLWIDVSLRNASAIGTNFQDSSWHGSNLSETDARYSSFKGAQITNTFISHLNLIQANLRNADFRGATWISPDFSVAYPPSFPDPSATVGWTPPYQLFSSHMNAQLAVAALEARHFQFSIFHRQQEMLWYHKSTDVYDCFARIGATAIVSDRYIHDPATAHLEIHPTPPINPLLTPMLDGSDPQELHFCCLPLGYCEKTHTGADNT